MVVMKVITLARQFGTWAKTKIPSFMDRLSEASLELNMLLFPVALACIPHAIANKFTAFANGPDVLMFCAVLFADGWWKVRGREKLDKSAKAILETFGLIGTAVGSVLTMVLYFDQLGLLTSSIQNNEFIQHARAYFFYASFFYAFWIRLRPDASPVQRPEL